MITHVVMEPGSWDQRLDTIMLDSSDDDEAEQDFDMYVKECDLQHARIWKLMAVDTDKSRAE